MQSKTNDVARILNVNTKFSREGERGKREGERGRRRKKERDVTY